MSRRHFIHMKPNNLLTKLSIEFSTKLNWTRKGEIYIYIFKKKVPNVFGEAVFDQFLVLVLVETHENCVIAGLWSGFEVKHHLSSSLLRPQTPCVFLLPLSYCRSLKNYVIINAVSVFQVLLFGYEISFFPHDCQLIHNAV